MNVVSEKEGFHFTGLIEFINPKINQAFFRERGKKYQLTNAIRPRPAKVTRIFAVIPASFQAARRRRLSRRELVTTETELKAMAAEASMGFSRIPKSGMSAPAARGMPMTL
jgi:hypothetical protein